MTRVSRRDVDNMAGEVQQAIFGPTGVAWMLPAEERDMLIGHEPGTDGPDDPGFPATRIEVVDHPPRHDLDLVGIRQEGGDEGYLLGLFTHPPAHVKLFASGILATGYDPADVAIHELGHRFNYDHSLREAKVAMTVGPESAQVAGRPVVEGRVLVSGDTCPVCLLHSRTAEIVGLMDGLRKRAHLNHQVPVGLGGTIPLAARKASEARSNLALIAPMMPAGHEQLLIDLDENLSELQFALDGWLEPQDVTRAHQIAYRAWDKAYDVNAHYWLHTMHGMHEPQHMEALR